MSTKSACRGRGPSGGSLAPHSGCCRLGPAASETRRIWRLVDGSPPQLTFRPAGQSRQRALAFPMEPSPRQAPSTGRRYHETLAAGRYYGLRLLLRTGDTDRKREREAHPFGHPPFLVRSVVATSRPSRRTPPRSCRRDCSCSHRSCSARPSLPNTRTTPSHTGRTADSTFPWSLLVEAGAIARLDWTRRLGGRAITGNFAV